MFFHAEKANVSSLTMYDQLNFQINLSSKNIDRTTMLTHNTKIIFFFNAK